VDIKQLEYFVQVADVGSFTKASTLLSIAQPALSRQVRQLEIELKKTLLYRNGRGVSLTDAGNRLIEHARSILQQVDRARDEMGRTTGTPVGRVIVAAPPRVEILLTVPLVKRFRVQFPSANLAMIGAPSFYVMEWVATGRVDIGIAYNPQASPAVEIIPLLEEEMFLICPGGATHKAARRGAVPLKDLQRYPLIIPSRPNAMRLYLETQLANIGLRMKVALEIDSVPAALDLVAEGYGNAVLPLNAIRGQPAERFTARPFTQPLKSHLALVMSAQRPATSLTRMTLDLMREIGPGVLAPKSTTPSRARAR
jgi:LysR family nitrogen assimilation transcriptional regulator